MSFINMDFYSNTLEMSCHCNVILPNDITNSNKPAKVLYLLHGLSDDCSKWSRYTALERKVHGKNIAVIMPEVHRSFYTDMRFGIKYFQYIAYELPDLCQRMFNLSSKREDNFIAGLSMGGYGALKTAFTRTDLFSKVASFSGALNFKRNLDDKSASNIYSEKRLNELVAICGKDMKLTDEEDPFYLARKVHDEGKAPEVLLTCGTEDFLYQDNLKFKNYLADIGYPAKFLEWKGNHNWTFWDESLDHLIEFLSV